MSQNTLVETLTNDKRFYITTYLQYDIVYHNKNAMYFLAYI